MALGRQDVREKALELGFHKVGVVSLAEVSECDLASSKASLERWLAAGFHGGMAWMAAPKRQDIYQVMPDVKSVICVALNYYTPYSHVHAPDTGKISRYGWGRDYHRVMQKRLKRLSEWLRSQQPNSQTRFYADTGPIQEKFWAQQAGIGWVAKNGNLITREYGSWVFLGEILTTLSLESDRPHTSHCGTCTRCLEACPTGAITAPYVVDANRCIAYHTIENRSDRLPADVAGKMNGWVAGCDICQDVCPWNDRFAQETDIQDFQPYPKNVAPSLSELENLSEEEWNRRFPASALRRIKPAMWRRNARAAQQSAGI